MSTNTSAAFQPNFEYLCRICAANTKGKYSGAECVYILRTPLLKEKIEKHLYLTVSESDLLPKVLCKQCFRQVEATASLSKIATHTQKVFRDFLVSLKQPNLNLNYNYETDQMASEYTPLALTTRESEQFRTSTMRERPLTPAQPQPLPAPPILSALPTLTPAPAQAEQPLPRTDVPARKDDVIVNVSVTDPLTRETQQKMISASQKQQTTMDARYTPKSIAQRAFTTITPKPKASCSSVTRKKQSPPGLINFFHGRQGQQQQSEHHLPQPQQAHQQHHHPQNQQQQYHQGQAASFRPGSFMTGGASVRFLSKGSSSSTSTTEVNRVLHQKRNNLKMALNSIKASKSGQVSLLKVSQKVQPAQPKRTLTPPPPPAPAPLPPATLAQVDDEHVDEALPEKIIIAAAKQKINKRTRSAPEKIVRAESEKTREDSPEESQAHSSSLSDDFILGRVIKDADLLKLILNALKWPVNERTLEMQMSRLKSSKFIDIMSDPNLLQDADLTQILGPVLHATHAMQQKRIAEEAASTSKAAADAAAATAAAIAAADKQKATDLQNAVGLANAMPYKLPAETSVQLVPAVSDEDDKLKSTASSLQVLKREARSCPKVNPPKKMRKATPKKFRDPSIVISDEDELVWAAARCDKSRNDTQSSPNFIEFDPSILSGFIGGAAGDTSSEALLALLQRQRAAMGRMHRSSRRVTIDCHATSATNLADQGASMPPPAPTATSVATTTSLSSLELSSFPAPSKVSLPLITRPIIKRRKTVIQASPAKTNLNIEREELAPPTLTTAAVANINNADRLPEVEKELPPMPPLTKKPSIDNNDYPHSQTVSTQVPSELLSAATQIPSQTGVVDIITPTATATASKSSATIAIVTATASTSVTELNAETLPLPLPSKASGKKLAKSALGQQLLEAIGLQKVPGTSGGSSGAESSSPRESIQKIRTALKQSLKQAQEQQRQHQQRKQAEPVKRIADSTTKSVIKEVLVEGKTKNSSLVVNEQDVEDEIDKIPMVVENTAKTLPARQRRSNIPMYKNRRTPTQLAVAKKADLTKVVAEAEADRPNEGQDNDTDYEIIEKGATVNVIETSDVATLEGLEESTPISLPESEPAAETETSSSKKSDASRKRGRKRKDDKLTETGRAESSTRAGRKPVTFDSDYEQDSDADSVKNDEASTDTKSPLRPTRVSKTLSKYYKGPDKRTPLRRSAPTRLTRSRI